MLTLVGNQALSQEGIQAIVNLVAGAVPDLRPENITVVDWHLRLLAQAGDPEDSRTRSRLAHDLSRSMSVRLARSVEEMLERSLGAGHVHAEAAVRINFDKTNETLEHFEPDGTVVRIRRMSPRTTRRRTTSTRSRCRTTCPMPIHRRSPPEVRKAGRKRRPTTRSARRSITLSVTSLRLSGFHGGDGGRGR